MNIVIINGSPRTTGLTANILHIVEKRLIEKGVNVHFYDLIKLDIEQCRGCCACYKNGCCIYNDDAEKLSLEISNADGIVVGSPTYASNISGILKTFVDRGHFVIEQILYKKYAVSVATGENYGSRDTCNILNRLFSYSGATVSGKIIYNAPFNSSFSNDKKAISTADKLYDDISFHRNYIIQKIKRDIIFCFGIRPFVMKKGKEYKGGNRQMEAYRSN